MSRFCGRCGGRMVIETTRGGIPHRQCENAPHSEHNDTEYTA